MVVCHCRSDRASWNHAINPNNQWGKFLMFRDFRIFFFVKTLKTWLPVFSSTGEKLSSCHAILTSRKMNRLNRHNSFWIPKGRTRSKELPHDGERDRRRQGALATGAEMSGSLHGKQRWRKNAQTAIDKLLGVQHGGVWELKTTWAPSYKGAPTILWDSLPGA